ncbi:MAG: AbrB/MazE/SpoVT family DNA-binding domain-containing protein [Candidatus Thermoplasmatota archaeon]|nr:AbrB/MazE/SpoVT family DNA-binding domain-containing protein [Candidatus Thermoplasmatota archaeon]
MNKIPSRSIRKIVQIGNARGVILPAHWLDYFGLDRGDEIEVITNGNVTITPIKKRNK